MDVELTHFFTFFHTLGGVQTVLRHHHGQDPRLGIQSRFVIFFETGQDPVPRVEFLGLSGWSTVRSARRKFREAVRRGRTGVAIYLNGWGLPIFADLDGAARRIAVLHTHHPRLEADLPRLRGLVDGMLCVTASLAENIPAALPELPNERIELLPVPISVPDQHRDKTPLAGRRVIFGFSGRVSKDQKRVDRLPEVVRCLDQAGIEFRFDVVGDGPERRWLEARFRGDSRVRVYGQLSGQEYWNVLGQWDFAVFVSDFEGLPITMLEAMSFGALPLYPAIGSGGDAYAAGLRPDLLYPPNDLRRLASTVTTLLRTDPDPMPDLRRRAQSAAAQHRVDRYDTIFGCFVRKILELPRLSTASFPARPFFWTDHVPFGALRRLQRDGFFRRNDDRMAGPGSRGPVAGSPRRAQGTPDD